MVFLALLLIACVSDVRTRRIPNWLTSVLAVAGLLFSLAGHPVMRGLAVAFGGCFVGLLLWFPSYLFRLLGAGDVKLFAAAGAWLGPMRALEAALIGAIVGGGLALVWLVRRRGTHGAAWALWAARVSPGALMPKPIGAPAGERIPYSIALSLGLVAAAWLPRHLF
ncbi:MAG: prepilin peptidase [Gemmatimonadota bacterium]|nr:prepilin peptidase [Gemmatimonadota bacterium]